MSILLISLLFLISDFKQIHSNNIKQSKEYQTKTCNIINYDKNAVWKKENFPNPQTDIEMDHCGRKCKPSWICDPHHMLASEEVDKLENTIEHIRTIKVSEKANCSSTDDLYSISIAIVPKLHHGSLDAIKQEADTFSEYLRQRSWKFSKCDNDIVIFVSINDTLVSTSAGKGVIHTIPNVCFDKIQKEAAKHINSGNVSASLNHLLDRISFALENGVCFDENLHYPRYASLPSEAIIGGVGVCVVLFGYGAYVLNKDMKLKAKEKEEALKHSSKRKRKRKLSLQQIKARRQSQQNMIALKTRQMDTQLKIVITNEEGQDVEKSDDEVRVELVKTV